MENETTRKACSMIVALALVGMALIGSAPTAQAAESGGTDEAEATGPCIKVSTDPPAVGIGPEDCKPSTAENLTGPP
jgi:hypothetical protein